MKWQLTIRQKSLSQGLTYRVHLPVKESYNQRSQQKLHKFGLLYYNKLNSFMATIARLLLDL